MQTAAAAATRGPYRWVKQWVPQDLAVAGATCSLYKWVREDKLSALKAKDKEQEEETAKPKPTTEVLFLCSYDGCGKTFVDTGALRKHTHVHGQRQYICEHPGCGKKFLDNSKLKRHFLIHSGIKSYACHHEGCGKAFSLDFNLKAHMKTHSADNYHFCPYPECDRRYTQESKLRAHIKGQHEKVGVQNPGEPSINRNALGNHTHNTAKPLPTPPVPSAERPYACPYDGCAKTYIHEYKLNLHLRKEHPNHYPDAGAQAGPSGGAVSKSSRRRSKLNITAKIPLPMIPKRQGGYTSASPAVIIPEEEQLPRKLLYDKDDSEETEEEADTMEEGGWKHRAASSSDDDEMEEDE